MVLNMSLCSQTAEMVKKPRPCVSGNNSLQANLTQPDFSGSSPFPKSLDFDLSFSLSSNGECSHLCLKTPPKNQVESGEEIGHWLIPNLIITPYTQPTSTSRSLQPHLLFSVKESPPPLSCEMPQILHLEGVSLLQYLLFPLTILASSYYNSLFE